MIASYAILQLRRPFRLNMLTCVFVILSVSCVGLQALSDVALQTLLPAWLQPNTLEAARTYHDVFAAYQPFASLSFGLAALIGLIVQFAGSPISVLAREQQLQTAVEHAAQKSFIVDTSGRIRETYGELDSQSLWYEQQPVIGKQLWTLPGTPEKLAAQLKDAVHKAARLYPSTIHEEHTDNFGHTREIEIRISCIGNPRLRGRFVLVSVKDQSAKNNLLSNLVRAGEHNRSLVANSMDALACIEYRPGIHLDWSLDRQIDALFDGVIVECNEHFARAVGKTTRSATLGTQIKDHWKRDSLGVGFCQAFVESGYKLTNRQTRHGDIEDEENFREFLTNCRGEIEGGRLNRAVLVVRDVTEQSRHVRAITQAAQRHDSLMRATEAYYCYNYPTPIDISMSTDEQIEALLEGHLVECNQAFAELSNAASTDELIDLTPREIAARHTGEENISRILKQFIESGYSARDFRTKGEFQDGTAFSHVHRGESVLINGQLVRRWGIITDVTKTDSLFQAAAQSEAQFRRVADNSPALIYRISMSDPIRIDFINDAIHPISGYSHSEVIEKEVLVHEVFSKRNLARLKHQISRNSTEPVKTQHLHKTNGVVYLEHRIEPVFADDGTLLAIEGVALDITERVQLQRELQAAFAEMERLKSQIPENPASAIKPAAAAKVPDGFAHIIGSSPALVHALQLASKAGPTEATVLILGETGAGKELFAKAIHRTSQRSDRPLVSMNCAALPASLIESELFGYEKGAFTGADKTRKGRFEAADGGTLFLDEVGEISIELQSKLLRVVQDGAFERLGGNTTIKVDVRIIAATNRDLAQEVARGEFRADLYYRLNVFPVTVPPLRDRVEDVPLLAEYFVKKYAQRHGKNFTSIAPQFLQDLTRREWPGNVRELEAVIERAVIVSTGTILNPITEPFLKSKGLTNFDNDLTRVAEVFDHGLDEAERQHIVRLLNQTNWVIEGENGTAKCLNIAPSTLRSRMKKLGIERPHAAPKDGKPKAHAQNVH